jgi:hypothetical protein
VPTALTYFNASEQTFLVALEQHSAVHQHHTVDTCTPSGNPLNTLPAAGQVALPASLGVAWPSPTAVAASTLPQVFLAPGEVQCT